MAKERRSRLLSVKNVLDKKFEEYTHFKGVLKKVLGTPDVGGYWAIQGPEKNGKTWLSVMLAVDFSREYNTLYISGEEGISKWFQDTLSRVGTDTNNCNLLLEEYMELEEIEHYISRRRGRISVVILDNATVYADELKNGHVRRLQKKYPDTLFIVPMHEEDGKPYTATAKLIKKLAKVIFIVKGLRVEVGGRVPGGLFDIDTEAAALYHGQMDDN
ncbi:MULTISPECIES: hypothetical protein [Sphingobacterium]|uniref:hypothetical protein n=1 Tax=Sphingobacterium TaxID=28453 RepID=UPI00258040B4|nr:MULTISPECIES: hypothetical protein [Sphingobacterium]